MGWLGWSEQQALDADVNAILVAYQGRVGMLNAIFGGEPEPEQMTPRTLREALGK